MQIMQNRILRWHFVLLLAFIAGIFWIGPGNTSDEVQTETISDERTGQISNDSQQDFYGFSTERFEVVTDKIEPGETLSAVLHRYGATPEEIDAIQKKVAGYIDLNRIAPGQEYRIYKDEAHAVGMVWDMLPSSYLTVNWVEGYRNIKVSENRYRTITRQKTASGVIEYSLSETLQRLNLPQTIGTSLASIFAWQIDFFRLQIGDNFRIVYEEEFVNGRRLRTGRITAAEFTHREQVFTAYYFENDRQQGYFDREGNSLQQTLLRAPFRYHQRISSGFSHNRLHPVLHVHRPHYGIDYAAPTGTPVISTGDGIVTEARYRGDNGNIVRIRHNSVYSTAYLHLSRFATGIQPGADVKQGQVIGYVGETGLSTGPHLDYRLYVNGTPVNSLTVNLPAGKGLSGEDLVEFQFHRQLLDRMLPGISLPLALSYTGV
ncbi:MAG: peptidoglycan DD-metalloendopeptidase family protein [Balneolaceae bacterium]